MHVGSQRRGMHAGGIDEEAVAPLVCDELVIRYESACRIVAEPPAISAGSALPRTIVDSCPSAHLIPVHPLFVSISVSCITIFT